MDDVILHEKMIAHLELAQQKAKVSVYLKPALKKLNPLLLELMINSYKAGYEDAKKERS